MRQPPRVVIRTEGGPAIGFGQVRRCLSLAQALRRRKAEIVFLINDDAAMRREVAALGFEAEPIATARDPHATIRRCKTLRAQVVVVDSYRFSAAWFQELMGAGWRILAIDDLQERKFPEDVTVVNCTPGAWPLAPRTFRPHDLLGPAYALLRPEFAKPVTRRLNHPVERLLITIGGGDSHGLTPRLIDWTRCALGPIRIDVVIGPLFDQKIVGRLNGHRDGVTCHHQPLNIRDVMLSADLAISGGGQTTYELAATGTPAIAVRLADNQTQNLKGFESAGAMVWAGDATDRRLQDKISDELKTLAQDVAERRRLGARGREMVDGRGANRVARFILDRSA